jgi:hypothetical protein
MSQAERPDRLQPGREPTVEDVRDLVHAATPHFAMQVSVRVRRLIEPLPADHPARVEGEKALEQLAEIARVTGEPRGAGPLSEPVGRPLAGGAPSGAQNG